MEINDPWLADLIRRVDAGETIIDALDFSQTPDANADDSTDAKIEALTDMICRAGNESAAALFVVMATLESLVHPKLLANSVKHLAFTHCADANLYGIVDAQVAMFENELFAGSTMS